jgi:protein-S-isoprenylcysteine O-methyltransferase Ste14
MLLLLIKFTILVTCSLFILGMQLGFSRDNWNWSPQQIITFGSIAASVGAAAYLCWTVKQPDVEFAALGIMVSWAACGLFIWALLTHPSKPGRAMAGTTPEVIVRNGPYQWIRHPIYLAYILALVAATFITQHPILVGFSVWMIVLYTYAARMEEKIILQSPNGDQYAAYINETGLFWPRLFKT